MAIQTFTLKSGAVLQIDDKPAFEKSIVLMETVGRVILGKDPDLQFDMVALFDPSVRAAVYDLFPWTIYDNVKVTPALFNDEKMGEKITGDWFEIAKMIVEVNRRRFFPRTSSGSSIPEGEATKDQK